MKIIFIICIIVAFILLIISLMNIASKSDEKAEKTFNERHRKP